MPKTATFIADVSENFKGHVEHFRLSEPLAKWDGKSFDYVVVSAVDAMFTGPEVYIFGADAEGNVLNWSELNGSYRGGFDIDEALESAGYTVVREVAA